MKKVLVVDDSATNRMLIIEALQGRAACVEAVDGVDAVEKYMKAANAFDLAFLDIAMPRMDGVEVLKTIRAHESKMKTPPASCLPVILITGFPDRVPEGLEYGAGDYLVKPVFPELLVHKFEKFSRGGDR